MFRKFKIKNCSVAIRPDLPTICLQYLRETAQTERVAPTAPTAPIAPNENADRAVQANAGRIQVRRTTISGTTLFNVNGIVQDVGFDHLPTLMPNVAVVTADVEMPERIGNESNAVPNQGVGRVGGDVEVSESISNEPNAIGGADQDVGDDVEMPESISNEPNAIDGANGNQSVGDDSKVPEKNKVMPGNAAMPRIGHYIDPFRRTPGGFALYGRRRSVCVLPTISEN